MNDEQEIGRLIARYNINGDRGRVEDLAACFLEDGILDASGGRMEGRAAIIAGLSQPRGSSDLEVVRHHLTTSLIDVESDGRSATGRTYFSVMSNAGLDHHGVYVDRYLNVAGEWFIQAREVRIDWQSEGSLFRPLSVRGRPPARPAATSPQSEG